MFYHNFCIALSFALLLLELILISSLVAVRGFLVIF